MRQPWLFQRPHPFPSPAILCTKRRTTSRCRHCSAFPAPQTAIHAPGCGLRLNRIRATQPGPRLDWRHDPCLDGCHDPCLDERSRRVYGPSQGGAHGLLHLTPTLRTKRRTTPRCRHCSAFPAPQTAIHATPQHPGPNTPEPRTWGLTVVSRPQAQVSAHMLRDIHEAYSQAASKRAATRGALFLIPP